MKKSSFHRKACAGLLSVALPMSLPAWAASPPATRVILHDFSGADGAHPLGGVIVDVDPFTGIADQRLLGTTYSGGAHGFGTVFSIQNGAYSILHSFSPSEGKFPQSGLVEGPHGLFYGTLSGGGDTTTSRDGFGAVFTMNSVGTVAVLHQFHGPEGSVPIAPVTVDSAANVFGTAKYGGKSTYSGTFFKIAPDGTTTALVDFSKTPCEGPLGSLAVDSAGNYFSTTWMNTHRSAGCVWEYGADTSFTVLHKFNNGIGGREPRGGLVLGAGGGLYGTAYYSGDFGPGSLYRIAADGTETVLHHFHCGADGGYPNGQVTMNAKGVLYGVAASCGTGGGGVVYSYDTIRNVFRVVYPFKNDQTDGYLPIGPISIDEEGNLYGVTEYGGVNNLGIVFEIKQ